jgi:hypothetical protein
MKNLLAFLLTLFLFSSVYAEVRVVDKLEYRDGIAYAVGESKGFSGVYSSKWSNNNNALKVNYKNGKKDGEQISWYYNGILKSETLFQSGSQVRRIEYEFRDLFVVNLEEKIKKFLKNNVFNIFFIIYFGLIILTYKAFLDKNKVFRVRLFVFIVLSSLIMMMVISEGWAIIGIAGLAPVWIPVLLLIWIGFELEARLSKKR